MPLTYIPSTVLPNVFDRADGLGGRPGTITPAASIQLQQGSNTQVPGNVFEEEPDSPSIEFGEQTTVRHTYICDPVTAQIYMLGLPRGTLLQDSVGNISKVLSVTGDRMRGDRVRMTVISEVILYSPPDEFQLEILELNPALEKHPRYAFLPADIRNLVSYSVSAAQIVSAETAKSLISGISARPASLPTGGSWNWQTVQDAAQELLLKRRIGEDTFYLPGFRVVWHSYYFAPQNLNPGGYVEDPISQGGLPMFFWNPKYPFDPTDIYDNIFQYCAVVCPQFFSDGGASAHTRISWLRLCDTQEYVRTWFRVTRTWIGAPYAHWDSDLYTGLPSPYPPPPDRILS